MVLLSHPKTELETQRAALVLSDPRSVRRVSNHTCQRPRPPPALAARLAGPAAAQIFPSTGSLEAPERPGSAEPLTG